MKVPKWGIIYTILMAITICICLAMNISRTVSLSTFGFAVDSMERLYIGKELRIEVIVDNVVIKTISPKTSRGYAFTIQEDDTILLSTGSYVYTLDLDGNVLSKEEDVGTLTIYQIQKNSNVFNASDGTQYIFSSIFGRYQIDHITKEGSATIYQMPILDYIINLVLTITGISMFVFIPKIISKSAPY